jgi:hypothetical protein
MAPTEDGRPTEGTTDRAKSRRRLQITLGSLLAFIAGIAVTLAVLLPFTSWARRPVITNPHASMAGGQGFKPQNCISCHTSVPAGASSALGFK